MKIIETINEVRQCRLEQKGIVGFVPTMGCLHDGHTSLIKACKVRTKYTWVSIFVNPLQFGPNEDFAKYPRTREQDLALLKALGVDVVFFPKNEELYLKEFCSYVEVKGLSDVLCGAFRKGHFKGVTTVVLKLLNIVKPSVLFLGQKDAQQAIILKKMIDDLNVDVNVSVEPIVRDFAGLALSSRNRYLSDEQRKEAVKIYQSLCLAESLVKQGEFVSTKIIKDIENFLKESKLIKIDYVSIVDKKKLEPLDKIKKGETLLAIAAYVGQTRLIDNMEF